jgi:hypothetical protein
MIKFLKVIFLSFIALNLKGQTIKVYNQHSVGFSFSDYSSVGSFGIGEILQVNKRIPFRILAKTNYSANILKPNIYHSSDNVKANDFILEKKYFHSNIDLMLGGEVFYKNYGLGFTSELASFSFGKSISDSKYSDSNLLEVNPIKFSYIFSNKEQRNLRTTFYFVYTVSESFSVKLGATNQKNILKLTNIDNQNRYVSGGRVAPFISLRFNLEK